MVNYVVEFTSNYTHMNAIVDQSQSTVLESHVNMKNNATRASNESQWQVREHDARRENSGEEQKQKAKSTGGM